MRPGSRFRPNRLSLRDCMLRIQRATRRLKFDPNRQIFTSRDKVAQQLQKSLHTRNVPGGFVKWQLPFSLDTSMMFISSAPPNAKVPMHSHDGPGVRFIASGSIRYKGTELGAGDWMYIPKGKPYTFDVGELGASMFYCYAC